MEADVARGAMLGSCAFLALSGTRTARGRLPGDLAEKTAGEAWVRAGPAVVHGEAEIEEVLAVAVLEGHEGQAVGRAGERPRVGPAEDDRQVRVVLAQRAAQPHSCAKDDSIQIEIRSKSTAQCHANRHPSMLRSACAAACLQGTLHTDIRCQ